MPARQYQRINGLGVPRHVSLGLWVNGVALFNMLDGAFYDSGREAQDGGQGVQTAYWIRNAMFVEVARIWATLDSLRDSTLTWISTMADSAGRPSIQKVPTPIS